jgi:hypothetical protein
MASQLVSSTSRALASPGSNTVPVIFPGTVPRNGEISSSVQKKNQLINYFLAAYPAELKGQSVPRNK